MTAEVYSGLDGLTIWRKSSQQEYCYGMVVEDVAGLSFSLRAWRIKTPVSKVSQSVELSSLHSNLLVQYRFS